MILRIPTSTDPEVSDYDQRVELDGRTYRLRFRYNERSAFWYLDISDVDGVALVSGRKVVRGTNLLGRSRDPRLPPGILLVSGTDPDVVNLGAGGTAALFYLDADALAALVAEPDLETAILSEDLGGGGGPIGPPSDL